MSDLIGQSLGRYHILEQLGEGGMAVVYKAYDTRLEADVAVKVIRVENLTLGTMERALKRFEREAKALAKLNHQNIVNVTDYGEHEGKPYLVMPYFPGGTLKQKLGKPIPWQDAVEILLPIAEALDYAHSQNMVHRDVKPANILLTERGQPMLTDFGIAKVLDIEETMDLTGTSAAVGTPEYMAPEQTTAKTADHRADIYALGIVLHEMITGRKPYSADTPMAVLIMHARDPLPRPSKFVSGIPNEVEKVLIKTLAKSPDDRYQSMGEMFSAMEGLLERRKKEPAKVSKPRKKELNRKRRAVMGAIGIGIATLIALGWFLSQKKVFSNIFASITPTITFTPTSTETALFTPTATLTATPTATFTPTLTKTPIVLAAPTNYTGTLPLEMTDTKGISMRLVPAGEFIMGNDNSRYEDERPAHILYLEAFFIDKYEVTNAVYKKCVGAGGCSSLLYPGIGLGNGVVSYYNDSKYNNYPVVNVDWTMAEAFCEWRGGSLPTEAQWEKAARGTDGRTYPWGEGLDCSKANYSECKEFSDYLYYGFPVEVGSYPSGRSPYGVYDMAGNVSEWTRSIEKPYPYNPLDGREILVAPNESVIRRGGSYDINVDTIFRGSWWPFDPFEDIGFRCVHDVTP